MKEEAESIVSTASTDSYWRFCHTEHVRFADCDMFAHVNNAAYLTYVESARLAYYSHISGLAIGWRAGPTAWHNAATVPSSGDYSL